MTTPVVVAEDRTLRVPPGKIVRTAWVPIDAVCIANRSRMAIGDVELAYRRQLQLGEDQRWPPVVGRWEGERFRLYDGRHGYLAALMLGHERLFVAWVEDEGADHAASANRRASPQGSSAP